MEEYKKTLNNCKAFRQGKKHGIDIERDRILDIIRKFPYDNATGEISIKFSKDELIERIKE